MIQVVPGSTKWFWPGCKCSGNDTCAGHGAMPPGSSLATAKTETNVNWQPAPLVVTPWTINKLVACTPFQTLANEKVMQAGLALQGKKVKLQELKVVLNSEDGRFIPGMTVWVKGDGAAMAWAKDVFTVGDKEFILVPETAIQVVQWRSGS